MIAADPRKPTCALQSALRITRRSIHWPALPPPYSSAENALLLGIRYIAHLNTEMQKLPA